MVLILILLEIPQRVRCFEDTTPNVHLKTPSNVQRRTLSNVHLITLQMYSFNQVAFWL